MSIVSCVPLLSVCLFLPLFSLSSSCSAVNPLHRGCRWRLKCEARARLRLYLVAHAGHESKHSHPRCPLPVEGGNRGECCDCGGGCLRTRHVSFVSPRVRLFNHFNLKPKLNVKLLLLCRCCCCVLLLLLFATFGVVARASQRLATLCCLSPSLLLCPLPIISHLNFIMSRCPRPLHRP